MLSCDSTSVGTHVWSATPAPPKAGPRHASLIPARACGLQRAARGLWCALPRLIVFERGASRVAEASPVPHQRPLLEQSVRKREAVEWVEIPLRVPACEGDWLRHAPVLSCSTRTWFDIFMNGQKFKNMNFCTYEITSFAVSTP